MKSTRTAVENSNVWRATFDLLRKVHRGKFFQVTHLNSSPFLSLNLYLETVGDFSSMWTILYHIFSPLIPANLLLFHCFHTGNYSRLGMKEAPIGMDYRNPNVDGNGINATRVADSEQSCCRGAPW